MRNLHQQLINSEFKNRYLTLKKKLPKIKHLIHGGLENYYAGLENEQLLSYGYKNRLCDESIERTITNIEIGLEKIMGLDIIEGELYIHCHPRPTQGEKAREAVWQYDIFADYKPVAAIGMNFHKKNEQIISTIANIQGRDSKGIIELRKICGKTPWPIKSLSTIIKYLPKDIKIIRGVAATNHPIMNCEKFNKNQAFNLYDRTFKKLGMNAIRNPQGKLQYWELRK